MDILALLLNSYKEFYEKYATSKPYKFVFITIVTFILLVLIIFHFSYCFNLSALRITVKLLIVIAKAAIIGFITIPNGSRTPQAIGIIQIL